MKDISADELLFKVFVDQFNNKINTHNYGRYSVEDVLTKKFPVGFKHSLPIDEYFYFEIEINFTKQFVNTVMYFYKEKIQEGKHSSQFKESTNFTIIGLLQNKIHDFVLNEYKLQHPEYFINSSARPFAHNLNVSFDKLYKEQYGLDEKEFLFLQDRCNVFLKRSLLLQIL